MGTTQPSSPRTTLQHRHLVKLSYHALFRPSAASVRRTARSITIVVSVPHPVFLDGKSSDSSPQLVDPTVRRPITTKLLPTQRTQHSPRNRTRSVALQMTAETVSSL